MNEQDTHRILRQRGYELQSDGSYSKVAPGLARPRSVFQEPQAGRPPGRPAHAPGRQTANVVHDRRVPRTVSITFYISDRRQRDLDGMASTVLDCLVRAGALPDDNRFEVGRLIITAVDCKRGDERVEVVIGPNDEI